MWQECFSLILSVIFSGSVSAGWQLTVSPLVKVSRGEDAILSCCFTPSQPNYSGTITVKWMATASDTQPFFECSVKNDSMDGVNPCAFTDLKHSLKGDPRRGSASLIIRKVELTHTNTYFCRVEFDMYWNTKEEKMELFVEGKPQILSLLMVEMPCFSNNTPRRVQCEVEGNPLPKITWLSRSGLPSKDQGLCVQTDAYRVASCVPYPEGDKHKLFTCKAENELGEAERIYLTRSPRMIAVILRGIFVLMVLVVGLVIYCLKKYRQRQLSELTAGEDELQPESSMAESTSSPGVQIIQLTQQDPGVLYSPVNVQQ